MLLFFNNHYHNKEGFTWSTGICLLPQIKTEKRYSIRIGRPIMGGFC